MGCATFELDIIYIQAKPWEGPVGRPEIRKFAGALQGYRANKGVFTTTSSFSKDALECVVGIDSKNVLIDGQTLATLPILRHASRIFPGGAPLGKSRDADTGRS